MSNKAGGLRAVVTLVLITAVMALLLAAVNAITAQPIARARQEKTEKALSGVLAPGVTLAGPVEKFEDRTGLVSAVHKTTDGYVVEVTPSGYGGEIHMVVGVSGDLQVTGVVVISHGETSGLGAYAAASGEKGQRFRGQFVGASGVLAVTKDGGSIDALTGATVTSRAVTEGVNAALACAADLEGGAK